MKKIYLLFFAIIFSTSLYFLEFKKNPEQTLIICSKKGEIGNIQELFITSTAKDTCRAYHGISNDLIPKGGEVYGPGRKARFFDCRCSKALSMYDVTPNASLTFHEE